MAFTIPSSDEALAPTVQSQIFETDLSILVAALSQTGVVSGCGVTAQGSPDMTVAVASGTILAAGVSVAVTSGNLTVGAADATNPRVDLISASAAGVKTITAGTAAATASVKPPDLPSGHIGLAFVYVAANDTAINTNEITDKRAVLAAGLDVVKRQGGSSSDWSSGGSTTYTPGVATVQVGVTASMTAGSGPVTITFPQAFTNPPVVIGQPGEATINGNGFTVLITNVTASAFDCYPSSVPAPASATAKIHWIAIGI